MAKPSVPSMPTQRQIDEAVACVRRHCPDARILRVGPDGVQFDYPGSAQPRLEPFTPEV